MMLGRIILAVVALAIAGVAPPAEAASRALLIGVSDYDNSIGLSDLRGPVNDVRILRDALAARGVEHIYVLADGIDGGTRPTRAAILGALDRLANEAAAGDLVYVHLSGHGSQQFDLNGDEADGLDEVFMPADSDRAEPGAGTYPNAIVDEELGAAVDRIRAAGADVWLVLDSCFSGTGLRAASLAAAARYVDPRLLGFRGSFPEVPVAEVPLEVVPRATQDGRYLAFYAAQSMEVAREVNLKAGDPEDDGTGWYGLFTSKLASRLGDDSIVSYRQLFQAVLQDMNDSNAPGVAQLQTPLWEGDLIDAAVLGGRETLGIRQFRVSGGELAAGLVHGMSKGTLVALVDDAAAGPGDHVGYAQVKSLQAISAALRPVEADCIPDSASLCEIAGALPEAARYARIAARPIDTTLRLATPWSLRTGEPLAEGSVLMRQFRRAVDEVNASGPARVEVGGADFSVDAASDGGRLWFGRSVAIGTTPVGLSWQPSDGGLAPLLQRMAQAEQLAAMLNAVSGSVSVFNPSPVEVSAGLLQPAIGALDLSAVAPDPVKECLAAFATVAGKAPRVVPDFASLKQCDVLTVRAKGLVDGARDVNRIHIDSKFCIRTAHRRVEGIQAPVLVGPEMYICSDCPDPDGYSAGFERLFVLVTEAAANSEPLILSGLIENCDNARATATRSAAQARVAEFLNQIGRRPDTRNSGHGPSVANVWASAIRWQVLPRREAFARAGMVLD
jgi:hypothetical protein